MDGHGGPRWGFVIVAAWQLGGEVTGADVKSLAEG